jgi:hypothetical protein
MMNILSNRAFFLISGAFACAALLFPGDAGAQRRDYLTEPEIELVRDAQQIDLRIGVLRKAIERRLLVINNDSSRSKEMEKESSKWGEMPKGSKSQLYRDIDSILQKAIDDIDGVAERNADSRFFPKAVLTLASGCESYVPQFRKYLDTEPDERDRGSLLGSIDKCAQVTEASAKVPKDPPKKPKKPATNASPDR